MEKKTSHTRNLALLISGLLDCAFGGILLLFWLDLLPFNLAQLSLSRGWAAIIGAVMAVSGMAVVLYQVTGLKEPDE